MPARKEVKETVTYPPSKRKAPPFKPQRPTKLIRDSSNESASISRAENTTNGTIMARQISGSGRYTSTAQTHKRPTQNKSPMVIDSDLENEITNQPEDDSDSDLPLDPRQKKPSKTVPRAQPKESVSITSSPPDPGIDMQLEALVAATDNEVAIPQPLLLRLMHENFARKDTKIDKHAVVVLQKYLEIFVRETIARAAKSKNADVELGVASQSDAGWLDRKDLEKVAGSILLDF